MPSNLPTPSFILVGVDPASGPSFSVGPDGQLVDGDTLHPPFSARDCALSLTPLEREMFMHAALDLAAARFGADSSLTEGCERPYLAACDAALAELDGLFDRHVVGAHVPEGLLPGVPKRHRDAEHRAPEEEWLSRQTSLDGMMRVLARAPAA